MNPDQRKKIIEARLQEKYSPTKLEVIDDSEKHRGHEGSKSGAGHYRVIISTENFKNLKPIAIHRAIYQELNDLIPHEIHALQIKLQK